MALSLPRFISLGFEGKYLVSGEDGVMQFSGEDALSPLARIEVERAKCSEELVHLRYCYNNKYLRRLSEKDDSIAPIAVEPEEDQSKWSCTLFRPRPCPRDDQSDHSSSVITSDYSNACMSDTNFEFQIMAAAALDNSHIDQSAETAANVTTDSCLKLSFRSSAVAAFSVTDTHAVLQLPRYLILKGDNNKYLQRHYNHDAGYYELRFSGDEEDYLGAAMFEVFRIPGSDGSVRLRMVYAPNGFLRLNGSLIVTGARSTDSLFRNTQFIPVKLGSSNNSIGLRVRSNNWICKRSGAMDAFGATSTQIEASAVLEVEEAVHSRSVYDIKYRMEDAKIYDFAPVTSVTKDVNNQSQSTQEGELNFTYTETKSQSWGSMTGWGVGVSVSMSVRIPFIGGPSVELRAEYEGEYEWGETQETETQISTNLQLEVPPMAKTQVTMIVSRGTLEVPFSYTQRGILYDSSVIVTEIDGGVFTGVNTYVSYETGEQSL